MDGMKKKHRVSWRKITKPKDEGGLGLQAVKERNLAFLAKLNWRFHIEKQSTWARVLTHKYGNRPKVRLASRFSLQKGAYLTTWAALKKGEGIFNRGTKWIARKIASSLYGMING